MAQTAMSLLVDKLTSTNYNVWALQMQHYLKREALWLYISNPPNPGTDRDVMRDEKALAIIVLSVADDQLIHVTGKQKAGIWQNGADSYVSPGG